MAPTIRPIRPDDAERLVEFHDGLSQESRYFRFFTLHPTLPARDAAHLATVDGVDRTAFVAEADGRIVAVGRYDRSPTERDTAEVAFAVADELQGHGVGSDLLRDLAAHAVDHDITHFEAWVLPTNHRMLDLFRDVAGPVACEFDQGVVHVTFDVSAVSS